MDYPDHWSMRYVVHTVEGEAQTENIFHSIAFAQGFCEKQLALGKCSYITERMCDTSEEIPF